MTFEVVDESSHPISTFKHHGFSGSAQLQPSAAPVVHPTTASVHADLHGCYSCVLDYRTADR
jgi:hypothetical protein